MEKIIKKATKKVSKAIAQGGWKLKDYYLWDNWIADSRKFDSKMHRYSLCAPKKDSLTNKLYGPNDRHDLAYVRHAYSLDNGKTWIDTGESFNKEIIKSVGSMLWSGCCIVKEEVENNTCSFVMCITASCKDHKSGNYVQKIGTSLSKDGENWTPINICVEYQNMYDYDMTNEDGEGYCWRDPYLYYDKNDGLYHLLWGAKKRNLKDNKLIAVVGHAICLNNNTFTEWKLLPPIELPLDYGQAELPAIYFHNNYYYMFVCCQSAATSTCSYHIFASKNIDSNYELIYSSCRNNQDKKNHFVNKNIYALTIFETFDHQIKAVGFYDQLMGKDLMLTNTPIIDIDWNYNIHPSMPVPHIKYNQIVPNINGDFKFSDDENNYEHDEQKVID